MLTAIKRASLTGDQSTGTIKHSVHSRGSQDDLDTAQSEGRRVRTSCINKGDKGIGLTPIYDQHGWPT